MVWKWNPMMLYMMIAVGLMVVFGPGLWASFVLKRYNKDEYFSGNGVYLAQNLLNSLKMHDVSVEQTTLGDHYDPMSKTVRLTEKNCGKKTLTAVVVATHEVGHAIQDHTGYAPLRTRTRLVMVAAKLERIGAAMILLIPVMAVLTRVPSTGLLMFLGGLGTLCIPVLVHFFTLPTEFDASFNRALPILKSGVVIPEEDVPAARRILLACALTYVAGALVGLLNIWRWIRVLRR